MDDNRTINGNITSSLGHLFQLDILGLWYKGLTGTAPQKLFDIDRLIAVVFGNN